MRAILACLSLLLTNVRFANAQPQPFSCDENTLCLYHFDEPSGSIVYDECNLSNMGVARGTDIIPGVFGNARRFDGIDDYIPITDLSSSPNNQMTIEAWIYVRNYPVCSDWKYVYKRRGDTG